MSDRWAQDPELARVSAAIRWMTTRAETVARDAEGLWVAADGLGADRLAWEAQALADAAGEVLAQVERLGTRATVVQLRHTHKHN